MNRGIKRKEGNLIPAIKRRKDTFVSRNNIKNFIIDQPHGTAFANIPQIKQTVCRQLRQKVYHFGVVRHACPDTFPAVRQQKRRVNDKL